MHVAYRINMRENKYKVRKRKLFNHRSELGAAPGTLVSHSDLALYPTKLHVMAYNENDLVEVEINLPEDVTQYLEKYTVTWLNVSGIGNIDFLGRVLILEAAYTTVNF